jgi:hypothetical protein
VTTAGIVERAAMLTAMTTFAEGIAAGPGSAVVEEADIWRMQEELCDSWPECSKMRVEAGARTLTALVEKLRGSRETSFASVGPSRPIEMPEP